MTKSKTVLNERNLFEIIIILQKIFRK